MGAKSTKKKITEEEHYDKRGVLSEIVEEDVPLSLDDALKQDVLSGKRRRKLVEKADKLSGIIYKDYLKGLKTIRKVW